MTIRFGLLSSTMTSQPLSIPEPLGRYSRSRIYSRSWAQSFSMCATALAIALMTFMTVPPYSDLLFSSDDCLDLFERPNFLVTPIGGGTSPIVAHFDPPVDVDDHRVAL